ncbi:hypothetical protein VHEMI02085 [[Torrubiella] hemipterigena]|uniref:GPI anchored serine-rich protein n=1 Tax=[Torrubiella] hemipterigena TaxID=1531966 RepID=A0A0A1SUT2_9HYPO|nr:hypothetical protein VHEMI02085 [[Torrubiella] hemipterigena]
MKFAAAAVLLAAAVSAQEVDEIVYTTQMITVSKCPETVTDCPAESKTQHITSAVVPMTTSTIYQTNTHTVTSCGPEYTECPAHSTVVKTEVVAISTTVCPVTATQTPVTTAPTWNNGTTPAVSKPAQSTECQESNTPVVPVSSAPAACVPSSSVTAITKSYTTVLTSVEYSTVQITCPTQPAGGNCPGGENCPPQVPTTGAPVCPGPNCPQPTGGNNGTIGQPPVTAGAASFTGSALFAAAAGIAAFILA